MLNKHRYVLENVDEFERLEKQSTSPHYNVELELQDLSLSPGMKILDAGCGSGVATRHLALKHEESELIGCDLSSDRIHRARLKAKDIKNCSFAEEDLTATRFRDSSFDVVICRYVLEHLTSAKIHQVLKEFKRILKPKGTLCVVDMDGFFFNLYPTSSLIEEAFKALRQRAVPDLEIGRKLPALLIQEGFTDLNVRIDAINCFSDTKNLEIEMMKEKLVQTRPLFGELLKSELKAKRFEKEYLEFASEASGMLFHNKFVVTGKNSKE